MQKFCFGITTKYFCSSIFYSVVYGFRGGQPQTELMPTWFSSHGEGFFPISVRSKLGAAWRGQPGEPNRTSVMTSCTLEKWGGMGTAHSVKMAIKYESNGILPCLAWHNWLRDYHVLSAVGLIPKPCTVKDRMAGPCVCACIWSHRAWWRQHFSQAGGVPLSSFSPLHIWDYSEQDRTGLHASPL